MTDELRAALAEALDDREFRGAVNPDTRADALLRALAARGHRLVSESVPDVEALANTLMDLRMDGPWSRPPSELTYQEAMRRYARLLLAALHPADPLALPTESR